MLIGVVSIQTDVVCNEGYVCDGEYFTTTRVSLIRITLNFSILSSFVTFLLNISTVCFLLYYYCHRILNERSVVTGPIHWQRRRQSTNGSSNSSGIRIKNKNFVVHCFWCRSICILCWRWRCSDCLMLVVVLIIMMMGVFFFDHLDIQIRMYCYH